MTLGYTESMGEPKIVGSRSSALQEDESVVAGGRDTHYHGDAPECDRAAKGVSGGLAGTQYLSDKSTPTSG